jgi:uncharacterized protein YndB with AHSA1/START domain
MLDCWHAACVRDPLSTVTRSLMIAAPATAVWAALSRFDSISCWAPNVTHSAAASQTREGVGAVRRVQVGRNALLERVTDWRPLEGLTYTVEGLPPDAGQVQTTWRIDPQQGASMTSVSTVIEPLPGPRGRVVERVAARLLGRAAEQMLQGLKDQLSSEAGPS